MITYTIVNKFRSSVLLFACYFSTEMQSEGSIKDLGKPLSVSDKKLQCPWGIAITDHVAPTFRSILEENFMSLYRHK